MFIPQISNFYFETRMNYEHDYRNLFYSLFFYNLTGKNG